MHKLFSSGHFLTWITKINQPIKMTDWPSDARTFSRPASKDREKRPGDEVDIFHKHLKEIELESAIIWKVVTWQRIISKTYSNSVGRYLSPQCWSADTLFWRLSTDHNLDGHMEITIPGCRLQAPKLARKCEIKHCYACGADRQAVGVRSRDCQIF